MYLQDRLFILQPSQAEATICDTDFTVNSIQVETGCSPSGGESAVEDLPSSSKYKSSVKKYGMI